MSLIRSGFKTTSKFFSSISILPSRGISARAKRAHEFYF
jgi:hypothetical protein